MIPGIPDFLLTGGSGGMTLAPSSTAESGTGPVNNALNFGNSVSGPGAGGGMSTGNLLVVGAVVLAAVYLLRGK